MKNPLPPGLVPAAGRRRRLLLALSVSPLLLAAGCGRESAPGTSAPIRIGAYYWPGMYWVDIAHRKGWFREAGLNVEWVDTNADYFGSYDRLVAGRLDIVDFTQFDLIRYNAQGHRIVGFLAGDVSSGADALIARPGIERVSDLAGKRIALRKGTYLEYLWWVVTQRAGLDPSAAQIVDTLAENAQELLVKGEADAVFTWEPFATQALEAVKGTKLFDTSHVYGLAWSVFAARREFLDQRAAEVQKLVGVRQRTAAFIKERPDEAFAVVAEVNRKSVAEVRDLATRDRILDLRDNLAAFSYSTGTESLHGSSRRMNDFMVERGLVSGRLDTSELFNPSFVRALASAPQ